MIIQIVKEYVMNACFQSSKRIWPAFFEQHLLVVHAYSQQLAALNADPEILEITAYLHDIAAIQDFSLVRHHHLLGAEIATELLARHHYPTEFINRVAQCIRSHLRPCNPATVQTRKSACRKRTPCRNRSTGLLAVLYLPGSSL